MKTRFNRSEGFEALVAQVHRQFATDPRTTHEICEATTTPRAKCERWITPFGGSTCVQMLLAEYDTGGRLCQLSVISADGRWHELVSENNGDAPAGRLSLWTDTELARATAAKLRHCFRWQRRPSLALAA
ncbi:MAG TPA: hypothetical protein VLF21_03285 [Candidatus Saccharimonadales bacterium]|nr:hypothetical protein [Candidatus Saccharimonadales bacterium]